MAEFSILKGKHLTQIEVLKDAENGDDIILFYCKTGEVFKMYHEQDCCERVYLKGIDGKLAQLLSLWDDKHPIIMAECVTENHDEDYESITHSFYKLATTLGYVTIAWYGESNGYYSERVDFKQIGVLEDD